MKTKPLKSLFPVIALIGFAFMLLSGCAGGDSLNSSEMLQPDMALKTPANSRTFKESFPPVWGAVEKAFLTWGFRIDRFDANGGTVIGTYLLDEDDQTTTLRLSITAQIESSGTLLSASAVETRHTTDTEKSSWQLLFPWVVPASTGPTIITSETINNSDFYHRFFDLIEKELGNPRLVTKVSE